MGVLVDLMRKARSDQRQAENAGIPVPGICREPAEPAFHTNFTDNTTGTDRAELTALVNRVADYNGFTPEQRQEALEIAIADPVAALECFRTLAADLPIPKENNAIRN